MTEPRWILEKSALAVHSMLVEEHGGANGIRDKHMLASALNRPRDKYTYEPSCSIFQLAAAYSFGLAKNHPFIDGNKRVAFLCGAIFLELNGFLFTAAEADTVLVFENLAAGNISETELTTWFEQNTNKA